MLSNKEIENIYDTFIKPNDTREYVSRYVPLPLHLNNKKWKWEKKDFPRVIALLEFRKYILGWNRTFDNVLSFNGGGDPEYEYLKYKKCFDYDYSKNIKYDLHCLDLEKRDFDFVMINQTIEHLYDPVLAIKNIYSHMRSGGVFYANVPVDNVPHSTPFHFYTGITPVGLGVMVRLAGFDILSIGQWGNRIYFKQMYDKLWSDYTYASNPGYNDFSCPLITWCFAIKR